MKKILLFLLLLIPLNIFALEVSSKSAILMDEDTGRILYSKNIDDKKLIASTTKIMTAILAIESGKLDDVVVVKDDILEAYRGLGFNDKVLMYKMKEMWNYWSDTIELEHDLLKSLRLAGNETEYIQIMNKVYDCWKIKENYGLFKFYQ